MARIKELSIGVSRTFNLGNFASLRLEASGAASVEEGDEPETVRAMLLEECRASLRAAYQEHHPSQQKG